MGEFRYNWHEEQFGGSDFKAWLIPTLLVGKRGTDAWDELSAATDKFTDVNVTVQINGIEIDPTDFFEGVESNMHWRSERRAVELIRDDERLRALSNTAYEVEQELRKAALDRLRELGIELQEDDYHR